MKTPYLIGIITILFFGSYALTGSIAQGGLIPIETLQVTGNGVSPNGGDSDTSIATCPNTHPFLIGGTYRLGDQNGAYSISPTFDTSNNEYRVFVQSFGANPPSATAIALCANFNFPINGAMIGGELLNINTISLLVSAIGTNPVITGLIGITIAGIAGQAVWFFHKKKKSENF